MRKIYKRRFIGLLSALTLGLGGLVSSGVNISSRASLIEVESNSLQTSYTSQSNTDSGDDQFSDEELDKNTRSSKDSDISNNSTNNSQITIEMLSNPSRPGNNFDSKKLEANDIDVVDSDRVGFTDKGYFNSLSLVGLNERSRSKIGRFNDKGFPNGDSALIIANLGDIDGNTIGEAVVINSNLYNRDGVLDSSELLFPYRVVNLDTGNVRSKGRNLFDDTVAIEYNEIIEICIIIDLISENTSLDSLKSVSSIQFESI